ncbi:MAG: signal peptidase I [Verrucomicrobiota bacterium]|nr:signal peptidase I [Verrucomicrobiota bacterium]
MSYFENHKIRKQLKAVLHQAQTFKVSREDVLNGGEQTYLNERLDAARTAYAANDGAAMTAAGNELEKCVMELNPPKPLAGWRENFDVLVVAISVAMAFRAYFYQPFKIPTGSMMPTLYGIHSEARPFEASSILDDQPFKFVKWLITGESFKIVKAKASGELQITGDTNRKPGYMRIRVGLDDHYVPSDAVLRNPLTGMVALSGTGLRPGQRVKAGELIWSGVVVSGDFVFVNRWKWNFCHPQRGEVMVFSTTGINHLAPGTHYIKRMMGLPNETLQVKAPNLLVNGEPVSAPERVAMIAAKATPPRANMAYAGFNPSGDLQYRAPGKTLSMGVDTVTLGPDQYYAMGDNSFNSFDSRYWGPVPERKLLGPAAVVYWPLTSPRFGAIR